MKSTAEFDEPVSTRFPVGWLPMIEAKAKAQGCSRAELLRGWIWRGLLSCAADDDARRR
jgi:hypothetical protein